jgi:hypothetical protein
MTEYERGALQPPSGPPPGWYLDPGGMQLLRWWDGVQWTSHRQPLPAEPAEGAGRHRVHTAPNPVSSDAPASSSPAAALPGVTTAARASASPGPWVWPIAAAPVASLAVAVILASVSGPSLSTGACVTISYLAGDVLAFIFALRDTRWLRGAGDPAYPSMAFLCLLLSGWAYLLARAIRRKSGPDWGAFAAGAAVLVIVLAIAAPLANAAKTSNEVFNQSGVQSQIASWVRQKSGDTVTVACPSDPQMSAGSTFTCVATAADGSTVPIDVTVQDNSGDIVWQAG